MLCGYSRDIIEDDFRFLELRGMSIKERIAEGLTKVGMSQSELARSMGIRPQSVQNWCSGANEPSKKNIQKMAKIFGFSYEYLALGKTGPGQVDQELLTQAIVEVVTAAKELNVTLTPEQTGEIAADLYAYFSPPKSISSNISDIVRVIIQQITKRK